MTLAYISVGSNIGDRVGYVQQAHCLLNDSENVKVLSSSSLYETEPVGYKDQDWFVNAVLEIQTSLSPEKLLKTCQRIEKQLGRNREEESIHWGPRTLDLDILFYDNLIFADNSLVIPHPRMHERAYTLVPFLEIAPDFEHPVMKKTILELHNEHPEPEEVYLYGTRIVGL